MSNAMSQDAYDISRKNSEKLDDILVILKGEGEEQPGLLRTVRLHHDILFGKEGEDGVTHNVRTLMRFRTWLMCTVSACAGSLLTLLVAHFIK